MSAATSAPARRWFTRWTTIVPIAAMLVLAAVWGRTPGTAVVIAVAVLLGFAVLAAVHHAEVIADRVGEPFGSLILAVAVTIIEVGLIVTLILSGGAETSTLARDTVFAAVMITCNGIAGLALLTSSIKFGVSHFNAEGAGAALATVTTLTALTLVLPTFTASPGPQFSSPQLAFAAVASLSLYVLFVVTQTVRHRGFFLPVTPEGEILEDDDDGHAPGARQTMLSVVLLMVSLVTVVGLAKVESPAIEAGVQAAGLPQSFVGVVIALLVLLPETLAAVRTARRGRLQISLNLAYGSAMASIGLTIPVLAVASIWLPGPLTLGLEPVQLVLFAISVVVGVLTVVPGRATRLQGGVHLVLLATFIFLAAFP
jgi:Ca2+:H+ antiporter